MNKGRRQELKMLRYKRRIGKIRPLALAGEDAYYAYRSHSTPCSCWCCRPPKYSRSKENEEARKLADPVSEIVITGKCLVRQSPFVPSIESCEEEEMAMDIIREMYFED